MTTIKDVAEMANVSVATVSHVVRKTRYVSPELEKKVYDVINSLDTVPNFVTKQAQKDKNKTKLLLVYVADLQDKLQINILKNIQLVSNESNFLVVPVEYQGNISQRFESLHASFNEQIVGQIIVYSQKKIPKFPKNFYKIPFVFVSTNTYDAKDIPLIISNIAEGSEQATNHLLKSGHSRIAHIDFSNNDMNNAVLGFRKAYEKNDLLPLEEFISTKRLSENDLLEKLQGFFSKDAVKQPTAVLIDPTAIETTLNYFHQSGFKIPEDISVISLGNEEWYSLSNPPISSITHEFMEITKEIFTILESNTHENNIKKVLPTRFDLQHSTKGIATGPFGEKAATLDSVQLTDTEIEEIKQTKRTAVISFHYTGASWMNLHEAGISKVFNELNINIIGVTDAHFDAELQNKQIDSLLSLDPDIFIAIPTDVTKTAEAFKKIVDSPSQLILITNVPKGLTPQDYVSVVSVNELTNGRIAARGLCENLVAKGKNKVGLLTFDSDFYATNQRDSSAEQLINDDFPMLKIVDKISFKNENEVFEKAKKMLSDHPDIEGIYVSWDGPAQKVMEAMDTIGRQDIIVGTVDLDYSSALVIAEDGPIKCVSAQQPFEQGRAIALAAAQAILKKNVPSFIGIEPIIVNRKNLLNSWRTIFNEEPPKNLKELITQKRL